MTKTVAYLVGGDNWIPCFVSVYSLLDNNQNADIRVVIFSEEDQNNHFFSNTDVLKDVHSNFTLNFIKIPQQELEKLPTPPGEDPMFPKAVNAKLLIPKLFCDPPQNFLYLDPDTLILNNLDDLFERSLSKTTIAAAPDAQNMIAGLGVSLKKQYFNTGVMYVNNRRWLSTDVTDACFRFIRERKPIYMDQTSLNAVLHRRDDVDIISPRYNFIRSWKTNSDNNIVFSFDWNKINIIHYAGVPKPWHYRAEGTVNDYWLSYCNRTPFDDFYPKHRSSKLVEYIEAILKPFPRLRTIAKCIYQNL